MPTQGTLNASGSYQYIELIYLFTAPHPVSPFTTLLLDVPLSTLVVFLFIAHYTYFGMSRSMQLRNITISRHKQFISVVSLPIA